MLGRAGTSRVHYDHVGLPPVVVDVAKGVVNVEEHVRPNAGRGGAGTIVGRVILARCARRAQSGQAVGVENMDAKVVTSFIGNYAWLEFA